jgi:L-fuculose-phosphate aldolase
VPVGDYHPSGSGSLSTEVARHLADRSAMLMANHGLVTIGRSVDDALHSAAVVEHNAHIMWGALQLGDAVGLPAEAVENFTGVYRYIRGTWLPD